MLCSGKRNDLSVNRTEHDLTDGNYKFMKDVSGQTETKVIHKPGMNSTIYNDLIATQQWHKLLKNINGEYVLAVSYRGVENSMHL